MNINLSNLLLRGTASLLRWVSEAVMANGLYLWDPLPSKEVTTGRALGGFVPGDVREGAARAGARPVAPSGVCSSLLKKKKKKRSGSIVQSNLS